MALEQFWLSAIDADGAVMWQRWARLEPIDLRHAMDTIARLDPTIAEVLAERSGDKEMELAAHHVSPWAILPA